MNKKILTITVAILAVLLIGSGTALAYGGANSYDTLKDLTGMTDEEIIAQRDEGVRLGEVAETQGVYDEFRKAMLEYKIEIIKDRLEDGTLTQAEADTFIENLENCDGTAQGTCGLSESGIGFGRGAMSAARGNFNEHDSETGFRGMGRGRNFSS